LIGMGAFVEVDEREMNSTKFHRNTRLRIAAAGTYINAITAGVALVLILNFSFLISPFYGPQVLQVDTVLKEEQGGFNDGNLSPGDVIVAVKKIGDDDDDYINLDAEKGVTLFEVLNNETRDIECSVGDELILKIYNPTTKKYKEKEIILGPHYNLGILYEYISNSELRITKIYSKEEDGNNYDKHLKENLVITKINDTSIDVEDGDTLEILLTEFNLIEIKLTSESGRNYYLDAEIDGVLIGIYSRWYWMPKNEIARFFGGNFPDFLLRELFWLLIIAFSVTLFNMLPLPIFDGHRMVKELVNWGVGEDYKSKKKKTEKFIFKKDEKYYGLSEYRVEMIESVKIIMQYQSRIEERSEILLDKKYYSLIDKIGDGFKSTLCFNLPKQTKLKDGSSIEVSYEFWYDNRKRLKKGILYGISLFTMFIVVSNFLLSFLKFGLITFWI
ncbi:MAG: site-2 protease family protein, partial [Promethearchaeota archaeon]